MKTIGILGGMGWENTVSYYKGINEEINLRLEGLHSGKILIYSVNYEHIETMQRQNHFETAGKLLSKHAQTLQNAGAEGIILASNTMHKVANYIQNGINIPFIHIADSVTKELKKQNINHVLLLGNKLTMGEDIYKQRFLNARIETSVLDEEISNEVDRIIFEELHFGAVKPTSKKFVIKCIEQLAKNNPSLQAVVLASTELGKLILHEDIDLKLFSTLDIHVKDTVDFMIMKVLSPLSVPNA